MPKQPTPKGPAKKVQMVGKFAEKIEKAYPVKAMPSRPTTAAEGKSAAKGGKSTIDMKKKLARVDYNALGKLMKSKAKLPKTK